MMKDRIKSAIVMLGGLAVILVLRHFWSYSFDIFWLMLAVLCVGEVVALVNRRPDQSHCYKLVNLLYPVVFTAFLLIGFLANMPVHQIILFEMIFLVFVLIGLILIPSLQKNYKKLDKTERRSAREAIFGKALTTAYILIYPALLMCFMLLLNHIVEFDLITSLADNNIFGLFSILLVLATSMATDTMAMFCGKIFKGKKLCPTISYNKRVSGLVGGIFFAMVASVLMYFIFTTNADMLATFNDEKVYWWHFVIIGFFSGLMTSVGDLLGSYIKRRYFVKDFGNFFPGHGGFMDRLNGIILNIPVILISFLIIFNG